MINQLIIITLEDVADSAGNFNAIATRNGESQIVLASATHATRLTALTNCITALASTVYGDLSKNPISILKPNTLRLTS